VLVAALDRSDRDHKACAELLAEAHERRVVPAPVLVEVDHFLTRYGGPEPFLKVLEDVQRHAIDIEDLVPADYKRVAELRRTYAGLRVGFVDCAVLAIVERLAEPKLATLDHRHFAAMRPAHTDALLLLPESRAHQ
jgi:predicted nucleic acid-binding protein